MSTRSTVHHRSQKKQPRKKQWRPKVKTGCITCKLRRIKCDEAKPHCTRCISARRKCGGYTYSSGMSRELLELSLRIPATISEWVGTAEEQQSFHFFRNRTLKEVFGFSTAAWTEGILQMSISQTVIRHAAISLGALHWFFVANVPLGSADGHVQFALEQFNNSIKCVIGPSQTGSQTLDRTTMLAASVLYMIISSLQGNQTQVVGHLQGGLALLSDIESLPPHERKMTDPAFMDAMKHMLISHYTQLKVTGDRQLSTVPSWAHLVGSIERNARFDSLLDAYHSVEWLFNSLLSFLQSQESYAHTASTPSQAIILQSYRTQLASVDSKLADLLKRTPSWSHGLDSSRLSMIRLRKSVMFALLTILSVNGWGYPETAWDMVEPQLADIVAYAAEVLGATASLDEMTSDYKKESPSYSPPIRPAPIFIANFGVVQPLFLVATRSRNPQLRRKAIVLLLKYPRRESLWDSTVAGRLARACMEVEERVCDENGLDPSVASEFPELIRVLDSSVWVKERESHVTIRTVEQLHEGEPGYARRIDW